MKYILFEEGAVDELVSNRFFQTIDFDLGRALYELVSTGKTLIDLPANLTIIKLGDGIALASKSATKESHFLVFDLEQSNFLSAISATETVFVLQKALRLSKKLWQKMSLNFSERVISGTSKAILFPFPYRPTPYRVVFEQSPWIDRLRKRGFAGKFLLAYKSGYDKPNGADEQANLVNFKKVFEQIDVILSATKTASLETVVRSQQVVKVSELSSELIVNDTSIFHPYEEWMVNLTNTQRSFIDAEISGAHRIEGAAGTGKTLCLMLKAISALKKSEKEAGTLHVVFVTHSEATKRAILEFLVVLDPNNFTKRDRQNELNSLKICTLSELCAEQLSHKVSETEFIDRDALESKETQLLYVNQSYIDAKATDYPSHERFLSTNLKDFLRDTDDWTVTEMLQHEISVMIKGRAAESIDAYKKAPPLKYGIPIETSADKGFMFSIFRRYQDQLGAVSQFDTDDVVLTAIGQLDTPVWRRRRTRDGYDIIFIDETHLFNINELHIFHYFTKSEVQFPIVYSVDRTQAVGDHGWTNQDISESLSAGSNSEDQSKLKTVFRSAPQIVDLAFSIVSSGASLFTNFDNPLEATASSFTDEEERKAADPAYVQYPNDQAMIEGAFERAEVMQKEMDCKRGQILIVAFEKKMVEELRNYAQAKNKPHLLLKKRGDVEAVGEAEASGKFVVAHADFVGGLEFFGVIAIGVDNGRLPPSKDHSSDNSKHFLSYSSHNRLYVAVSRAKYRVELLGDRSRGPSELVTSALELEILKIQL